MKKVAYIEDWVKWENGFRFFHPVSVRFSETDMFGHLNNTVPFVYFEEARIEFFKKIGLMEDWTKETAPAMIVVADLQCDFIQQVFFGEKLNIFVKAETIGQSSVDLHYKGVNQKGDICFVGRGRVVQISRETHKPYPLSEEMKSKLTQNSR
ncbi:thioesterase family protein [Bacillus sp. REN10]|uniref:acyl-CoA thioesterase n=1 Tax=Bacillus sp. REN10 TaxID=2782541 RepID=UPI00193C0CB6|nr:thioesterase family protein [Bacillus sp. REN10]